MKIYGIILSVFCFSGIHAASKALNPWDESAVIEWLMFHPHWRMTEKGLPMTKESFAHWKEKSPETYTQTLKWWFEHKEEIEKRLGSTEPDAQMHNQRITVP